MRVILFQMILVSCCEMQTLLKILSGKGLQIQNPKIRLPVGKGTREKAFHSFWYPGAGSVRV